MVVATDLPRLRTLWEELGAAETAWSDALSAHHDATSPDGLRTRLAATRDAALRCAIALRKTAATDGMTWHGLGGDPARDIPLGELHPDRAPDTKEWVDLHLVIRRLSTAARTNDAVLLAEAFEFVAEGLRRVLEAGAASGSP